MIIDVFREDVSGRREFETMRDIAAWVEETVTPWVMESRPLWLVSHQPMRRPKIIRRRCEELLDLMDFADVDELGDVSRDDLRGWVSDPTRALGLDDVPSSAKWGKIWEADWSEVWPDGAERITEWLGPMYEWEYDPSHSMTVIDLFGVADEIMRINVAPAVEESFKCWYRQAWMHVRDLMLMAVERGVYQVDEIDPVGTERGDRPPEGMRTFSEFVSKVSESGVRGWRMPESERARVLDNLVKSIRVRDLLGYERPYTIVDKDLMFGG